VAPLALAEDTWVTRNTFQGKYAISYKEQATRK
jgi:hypothetical protein